jgi:hypothetical protein
VSWHEYRTEKVMVPFGILVVGMASDDDRELVEIAEHEDEEAMNKRSAVATGCRRFVSGGQL